ncbi:hypothetical protein D0869_00476 [Hortaea werneckii]|uniref:Uncharacterized protein n=1 Tax=Hortaea werneckii TaxID=91943 RepID=A0A3M6XHE8_HORWE|nr:hypothetical protein KC324_g12011 [Hortaea werneckii]KAI7550678.1 hypothetical protein KC316_g14272 [Hortaea werneckii]RMX89978.1 hypothetical protein D0869_00476 [Hortaea werneckii]RMY08020.1 hypothetical protein D0866_14813 [Hortaea werneckii]RMY14789.1 hypothetical protein D0868_01265 [Hortaea werneckii]
MPPVQLHLDDPVAPQHSQGVTPQTAAADPASATGPANNPATTTSAAAPAYPPAQPGQAAVPAPTPYAPPASQPAPTRTSQPPQNGSPPPPQPGAVPVPSSSLPPPPKAGESPTATAKPQGTAFTGVLNQMHIPPPPQTNLAPTHSTTVAAPAAGYVPPSGSGGPTTLNLGPVPPAAAPSSAVAQDGPGRRSSEHPPGYQQNVYAQEMTPAQRASLEGEQRREGFAAQLGGAFGGNAGPRDGGLGGGMMGGNAGSGVGGEGEGVWGTAKSWLGAAGSKLAETEEEVWRRINGK